MTAESVVVLPPVQLSAAQPRHGKKGGPRNVHKVHKPKARVPRRPKGGVGASKKSVETAPPVGERSPGLKRQLRSVSSASNLSSHSGIDSIPNTPPLSPSSSPSPSVSSDAARSAVPKPEPARSKKSSRRKKPSQRRRLTAANGGSDGGSSKGAVDATAQDAVVPPAPTAAVATAAALQPSPVSLAPAPEAAVPAVPATDGGKRRGSRRAVPSAAPAPARSQQAPAQDLNTPPPMPLHQAAAQQARQAQEARRAQRARQAALAQQARQLAAPAETVTPPSPVPPPQGQTMPPDAPAPAPAPAPSPSPVLAAPVRTPAAVASPIPQPSPPQQQQQQQEQQQQQQQPEIEGVEDESDTAEADVTLACRAIVGDVVTTLDVKGAAQKLSKLRNKYQPSVGGRVGATFVCQALVLCGSPGPRAALQAAFLSLSNLKSISSRDFLVGWMLVADDLEQLSSSHPEIHHNAGEMLGHAIHHGYMSLDALRPISARYKSLGRALEVCVYTLRWLSEHYTGRSKLFQMCHQSTFELVDACDVDVNDPDRLPRIMGQAGLDYLEPVLL